MSSHHFVKEGQEPAVIIEDATDFALFADLLEWSPIVVVLEDAAENFLMLGIKADVVVSAPDRMGLNKSRFSHQVPVSIVSNGPAGDPLHTALHYLIARRQTSSVIVTGEERNLFDTISPFSDRIDITILTPTLKWSFIRTGRYAKWLPAASALMVRGGSDILHAGNALKDGVVQIPVAGITILESAAPFWVGESL